MRTGVKNMNSLLANLYAKNIQQSFIRSFLDATSKGKNLSPLDSILKSLVGELVTPATVKKYLPSILMNVPKDVKPWDGICVQLSQATVGHPVLGALWRLWLSDVGVIYKQLFYNRQGAGTVDLDRLLYRTLYELYYFNTFDKNFFEIKNSVLFNMYEELP